MSEPGLHHRRPPTWQCRTASLISTWYLGGLGFYSRFWCIIRSSTRWLRMSSSIFGAMPLMIARAYSSVWRRTGTKIHPEAGDGGRRLFHTEVGNDLEVVVRGPSALLAGFLAELHQLGRRLRHQPRGSGTDPRTSRNVARRARLGTADLRRRTAELLGDVLDREALRGREFVQAHGRVRVGEGSDSNLR